MNQLLPPVLLGRNGFPKVPQGGGRYSIHKAAVRTYFTDQYRPPDQPRED